MYELGFENYILSGVKSLMNGALTRLKNSVFSNYFFHFKLHFVHFKLHEELHFIHSNQIVSKCVALKLNQINYIVADFTSYNEHD